MHPLVYQHPATADTTMLFHCGRPFCAGWGVSTIFPAKVHEAATPMPPMRIILPGASIQDEITDAINTSTCNGHDLVLTVKWQQHDFAILDNLALAHYAVPNTQKGAGASGLRILHRTTVYKGHAQT
eukprot:gene12409-15598_t